MSKEVNEERAPRTITDVKEMLSKHSNGEIPVSYTHLTPPTKRIV